MVKQKEKRKVEFNDIEFGNLVSVPLLLENTHPKVDLDSCKVLYLKQIAEILVRINLLIKQGVSEVRCQMYCSTSSSCCCCPKMGVVKKKKPIFLVAILINIPFVKQIKDTFSVSWGLSGGQYGFYKQWLIENLVKKYRYN